MPRVVLMSWIGSQKRWKKFYRGVPYYVSTRQLGTPPTMEGSVLAANEWWRAKQLEIDTANKDKGTPAAKMAVLENHIGKTIDSQEEASFALFSLMEKYKTPGSIPDAILEQVLGERYRKIQETVESVYWIVLEAPGEVKNSVGEWVDTFTQTQRDRISTGKVGAARMNMNRVCLHHFQDWIGADTPVKNITEATWLQWYAFLSKKVSDKVWSVAHVDRIYAVAKRFVKFLWSNRQIDLPRNLESKELTFSVPHQDIEIFTQEELQRLFDVLSGQTALHVLLMLNCGFIGMDINDLLQSEVDWVAGTITRKRSKTSDKENVPVVTWKLWQRTFELLKQYRSSDPEIVLLTTTGERWIKEWFDKENHYHRSDKVASALKYWLKRAKVEKAPKALRATSASKLGEHEIYGRYVQLFLGQAPHSIAEKHYDRPTKDRLFAAIDWLGKQFGVE